MTRLKFLVFAVLVLGLWGYHLVLVSPSVVARAAEQSAAAVLVAPATIGLRLESQRSSLQASALSLAGSTAVQNIGPKGSKEMPTVERLNAARAVVSDALPEALRAAAVVGLSTEGGALLALGRAEPAPLPEGFDLAAITAGGTAGSVVNVSGVPHLFYAVPLVVSDHSEVKGAGIAFVGLPVLPDVKPMLEALVKEQQLAAAGIASGGALVASAGPGKGLLESALKLKLGQVAPLKEGPVATLGPLKLPMFVGSAVQAIGVHREIAGTPYAVVAVASAEGPLEALADYQRFALGALVGLLLLTVVFSILLGAGEEDDVSRMSVPQPLPLPVPPKKAPVSSLPLPHHAPEASPDDFEFPGSQPSQLPPTESLPPLPPPPPPVPAEDPFAFAPPPPVESPPSARVPLPFQPPPSRTEENDDDQARTMAYPTFKPPGSSPPVPGPSTDPFAMAASGGLGQEPYNPDDNPDATRVAAVPQELIRAARSGAADTTGELPAHRHGAALPKVSSGIAPVTGGTPFDEDRHYQEVFRDFVSTREKCGEVADGLTFEKFRAKLIKNREQLIAKYACRTVRFQVYVKDGKAALKATPVKE